MRTVLSLLLVVPVLAEPTAKLRQRVSPVVTAVNKGAPALVTVMDESPKDKKAKGEATVIGVLVDAKGLILAPHRNGTAVAKIVLADGSKQTGRAIYSDAKIGLSLLKISSEKPLPPVKFADSDKIEVGNSVINLSRTGDDQLVMVGVISGVRRLAPSDDLYLQIDSSIGPGGVYPGPLVDLNGELIGMVTKPGGIGFAVPSNLLKTFLAIAAKQSNK